MKLSPLDNQVGGHDGVLSMGEENEIIVKPSLPQELRFYEEAVLHPELAAWMPSYYGTLTLTRQAEVLATDNGESAPTIKALNGYALTDLLSFDQLPSLASSHAQEQQQLELGGVTEPPEKDENDDECICLENVSHGFTKACVLDIKLGVQLFDDHATEEKKARLGAVSANTTSGRFGMRLTGFHVYDNEKGDFIKYSKQYGKSLTEETVLDGFRNFFAAKLGPERMRLVLERFVNDLTDFLATIETQELRMRSSSLLLIYEGEPEAFDEGVLMEQEKITAVVARAQAHMERASSSAVDAAAGGKDPETDEGRLRGDQDMESDDDDDDDDDDDEDYDDEDDDDEDELTQKVTDMRLIDFAHSTWTPGQGPDEGVILGVKSALSFIETLLAEDYSAEV